MTRRSVWLVGVAGLLFPAAFVACGHGGGRAPASPACDEDVQSDPACAEEGGAPEASPADAHAEAAAPEAGNGLLPDGAAPADRCLVAGDAGFCTNFAACQCTAKDSCTFACGPDEHDAGPIINCGTLETCGVSCVTDCSVQCAGTEGCSFSTGAGAQINCSGAVACEGTVGGGTTVNCQGAQTCLLTCTGPCSVNCAQTSSCRVTCDSDAGACDVQCPSGAPTTCPDGVTVVCDGTTC